MLVHLLFMLAGVGLLYYGAEALVRGAATLAVRSRMSPLLVGLTVVAFGTSAPELVVSVQAALEGILGIVKDNPLKDFETFVETWSAPDFTLELMPEIDWVAESRASLPALSAGRFWVYGSHIDERPPAGSIALMIDANLAFGTGRHETTRGCLLALNQLAKDRRRRPLKALDLGCGSGILGFGAARGEAGQRVLGQLVRVDEDDEPRPLAARGRQQAIVGGGTVGRRKHGGVGGLVRYERRIKVA